MDDSLATKGDILLVKRTRLSTRAFAQRWSNDGGVSSDALSLVGLVMGSHQFGRFEKRCSHITTAITTTTLTKNRGDTTRICFDGVPCSMALDLSSCGNVAYQFRHFLSRSTWDRQELLRYPIQNKRMMSM